MLSVTAGIAPGFPLIQGHGLLSPGVAGASTSVTEKVPAGQDHDCIVGRPPAHGADWAALHNPVLSYSDVGVKDQALQWSGSAWHMLFSEMVATKGRSAVQFNVAEATSANLVHWTAPHVIATDAASPDIVRDPAGQFVVTYQSERSQSAGNQLEYRVARSDSLAHWSTAHPLAPGLAPRMIDPALAFTGHGVILGFKAGTSSQHFEIAWAPALGGTFHLVGQPDITLYGDTVENYEFLTVNGRWTLVATSNTLDEPFVFTLGPGNPGAASTWLTWSAGRQLMVPDQPFDTASKGVNSVTYEHDNSAFLCVGPAGQDFLTYAASTELTAFGGWGHARIGIARSSDLVTWQVPPERP
jgi:hypothetical protein